MEELTIKEIEEKYPDEFISVAITTPDAETDEDTRGWVIAHGTDMGKVRQDAQEYLRQHPEVQHTYFIRNIPMPEGGVLL